MAYGPLALMPHQIDALTPRELHQMQAGYMWRLTHPAPEVVWLATVMMNRFGGGELPWTPETMIGMKPKVHG